MTTTMICPKAGVCGNDLCRHRVPHKDCPEKRCDVYGNPPCIPYKPELKVGSKVRLLVDSSRMETVTSSLGAIGEVEDLSKDGNDVFGVAVGGKYGSFNREDLELITEDEMEKKYKILRPLTLAELRKEANVVELTCFAENFLLWSTGKCLRHIDTPIKITDKLIKYAQRPDRKCFWEFLTENGYIEEVQSEYDKWVDECPYNSLSLTTPNKLRRSGYIEWAKRMPRKI